jgi:hypothetical protein
MAFGSPESPRPSTDHPEDREDYLLEWFLPPDAVPGDRGDVRCGAMDTFRDYIEKVAMTGVDGYGQSRPYISSEALRTYLSAERVSKVLDCATEEAGSERQRRRVYIPDISGRFLVVFAILVMLGETQWIGEFIRRNIDDDHLPLMNGSCPHPTKRRGILNPRHTADIRDRWTSSSFKTPKPGVKTIKSGVRTLPILSACNLPAINMLTSCGL